MSITPGPAVSLFHLLEWRPAKTLYTADLTWTGWMDTFYVNPANGWTHGKPAAIEETRTGYTEVFSAGDCDASASTWFWDSTTNSLYLHCGGDVNPNTLMTLAYMQEFYSTHSPIVLVSNSLNNYAEPRLLAGNIPPITIGTSGYHQGGTQQSFGAVKLANADGYFDARLSTFIYEAKLMRLFSGHFTAASAGDISQITAYVDLTPLWTGWSGNIKWSDMEIEISTEDYQKIMAKNVE